MKGLFKFIAAFAIILSASYVVGEISFVGRFSYLSENIDVDKELRPYFDEIVGHLKTNGVDIDLDQPISIQLVDDTGYGRGVIGVARGMFDWTRVDIVISRRAWNSFNKTEKLWVLLHEMGHDFWILTHGGNGIMRPYHKEGETYASYAKARDKMIAELRGYQGK